MSDDHYQIEVLVPLAQVDPDGLALVDFIADEAHDWFERLAIDAGRQSPDDCGDPDGPGCEGCNIFVAGRTIRLDTD